MASCLGVRELAHPILAPPAAESRVSATRSGSHSHQRWLAATLLVGVCHIRDSIFAKGRAVESRR